MQDPEQAVQRPLDAYNAEDVEGSLSANHPDAQQYVLHGAALAIGREAMRERILLRFAEPILRARLPSRVVVGAVVVDGEEIERTFPAGPGTIEMLCVYEAADGFITRASSATANKRLGFQRSAA